MPKKARLHTTKELEKLQALNRFGSLTARVFNEFAGLKTGEGSLKFTKAGFRKLADQGEVGIKRLPDGGNVYYLTNKGRRALDVDPHIRYRASERATTSPLHVRHTLNVNEFIVMSLKLNAKENITVSFFSESEIKAGYKMTARTPTGFVPVVPDAVIDIEIDRGDGIDRLVLLLELDGGTQGKATVQTKMRGFLYMDVAEYKQKFGTTSRAVCWVTTEGKKRQQQLVCWADELVRGYQGTEHTQFRFAHFDPATTPTETAYFERCWYSLDEARDVSLLGG